jgi:uncharacterized membrane protein
MTFELEKIAMTPSSILLAKQGYEKTEVLHSLINHWELPPRMRGICSKYFLLQWSSQHFFQQIHDGKLVVDDVEFCVVYKYSSPSKIRKSNTVWLSFRYCEIIDAAYVLVQHTDHVEAV